MAKAITSELIEKAADRLHAGRWRYTPRQLYYATCADAETPPSRSSATGQIGLGLVVVLVAFILIHFTIAFAVLLSVGLLLVLAGALQRRRPVKPLGGRVLAISFDDFAHRLGGVSPPGLLGAEHSAGATPQETSSGTLVVCDTAETAAVVNANAELARVPVVAVDAASLQDQHAHRRVIALHDASPRGCALALNLQDAGLDVVDAGLGPDRVSGAGFQALEGAPARLPRDLTAVLSGDDINWLASGRRVELAVLSPEAVLDLVRVALGERSR